LTVNDAESGDPVTVRLADIEPPEYEALIVTVLATGTLEVSIMNDALLEPPGTVTVLGTFATDVSLLDRDTSTPPLGADDDSVTVPCGCCCP
jgi:hypothetical protein